MDESKVRGREVVVVVGVVVGLMMMVWSGFVVLLSDNENGEIQD